jgi:hypothetical protein
MSYAKGISWFDDCRIPHNEDLSIIREEKVLDTQNQGWGFKSVSRDNSGRFPANILVSDDMLNDGKIYKSGEGKPHHKRNKTLGEYQGNAYGKFNNTNPQLNYENYYGDKGTNSRYYDIDKWFDNLLESCE